MSRWRRIALPGCVAATSDNQHDGGPEAAADRFTPSDVAGDVEAMNMTGIPTEVA